MPRKINDFYPTPMPLARTWMKLIDRLYHPTVIDAGAGGGNIGQAIRNEWQGDLKPSDLLAVDIQKAIPEHHCYDWWHVGDYLQMQLPKKADMTVSNPPYYKVGRSTMAQLFLEKAFDTTNYYVSFLLRATFLAGNYRQETLWKLRKPTDIWFLVQRPSFVDNKTERGMEYIICLWNMQKNTMFEEPRFHWLNWR